MLLDEPTAALDPDQRDRFVSLLDEISPGRIVLVSTHDVADLAVSYDRVVVLTEGRVRFDGSVTDFLRRGSTATPVDAYRSVTGITS